MTFNDLAKAHVRTIVPAVVGLIITLALRAGIDLHGYAPFITTAVTAAYYSAARLAEHYVDPRFGWLLGVVAAPRYTHPAKKTAAKDLSYTIKGRRNAGHVDVVTVLLVILVVVVIVVLLRAM